MNKMRIEPKKTYKIIKTLRTSIILIRKYIIISLETYVSERMT